MNRSLLHIKLQLLEFLPDELHLLLPTCTKIFFFPISEFSTEIPSDLISITFQLFSKGSSIFQGAINLRQASAKFHLTDHSASLHLQITVKPLKFSLRNKIELEVKKTLSRMKPAKINVERIKLTDFLQEKVQKGEMLEKFLESLVIGAEKKIELSEIRMGRTAALEDIYDAMRNRNEKSLESYQGNYKGFNDAIGEKDRQIEMLKKQIELLNKGIDEERKMRIAAGRNEEKCKEEVGALKNMLTKLRSEARGEHNVMKAMNDLRSVDKYKDSLINELKSKLRSQIEDFSSINSELHEKINILTQENIQIHALVTKLKQDLSVSSSMVSSLKIENTRLNSMLREEKSLEFILRKYADYQVPTYNNNLIDQLTAQIEGLNRLNKSLIFKTNKEKNELLFMTKSLQAVKRGESSKPQQPNSPQSRIHEHSLVLNKHLKAETEKLYNEITAVHNKSIYKTFTIYEGTDLLTIKLTECSEKLLYYQDLVSKLVKAALTIRAENNALLEKMVTVQQDYPYYLPINGDSTDFAMAHFLNSQQRALRVTFVRQEPNFYLFGTKTVLCRILGNKLCVVLNEGPMLIADFVERFTKQELTKLEVRKRFEDSRAVTTSQNATLTEPRVMTMTHKKRISHDEFWNESLSPQSSTSYKSLKKFDQILTKPSEISINLGTPQSRSSTKPTISSSQKALNPFLNKRK